MALRKRGWGKWLNPLVLGKAMGQAGLDFDLVPSILQRGGTEPTVYL